MLKLKKYLLTSLLISSITISILGCGNTKKVSLSSSEETNKIYTPLSSNKVKTKSTQTINKISSTNTSQKSKPTQVNKSVHKKVIVIDPGHANKSNLQKELLSPGSKVMKIKDGGGAQGTLTRTPEYKITMSVSKMLKTELEKKGYLVIMTKTNDSKSLGNIERAEIGNKNKANLVIRIHADSCNSSSVTGASMLVPGSIGYAKGISSISKNYGSTILQTLVKNIGMKNRGVMVRNDMTGFNWSKTPVVLVEMGFLSNPKEDKLLSSIDYQRKIAKALADGILKAVKKS